MAPRRTPHLLLLALLLLAASWPHQAACSGTADDDLVATVEAPLPGLDKLPFRPTSKEEAMLEALEQEKTFRSEPDALGGVYALWKDVFNATTTAVDTDYVKGGSEDKYRRAVWEDNVNTIIQVNKDPTRPYWLALNPYANLTPLEFRTKILSDLPYAEDPITQREAVTAKQAGVAEVVLNGLEGSNDTSVQAVGLLRGYTVPAQKPYVDWRNSNGKSYVTPIKDQGQCGSCTMFSACALLESYYHIKKNLAVTSTQVMDLSEQYFVNCVNAQFGYRSKGCGGGMTPDSLQYAYKYWAMYDASVPYTKSTYDNGITPACVQSPPGYQFKLARSTVAGYTGVQWVAAKSATALMQTLASKGPAGIYFNVGNDFFLYGGGQYRNDACTSDVNHAMVAIGYDTRTASAPYWIVKNSWSKYWGASGYVNIFMKGDNTDGTCGMYVYNPHLPGTV